MRDCDRAALECPACGCPQSKLIETRRRVLTIRGRPTGPIAEPPFAAQRSDWIHGAILGEECFALRWLTGGAHDRLLLVNLGAALRYEPAADPLLAPPAGFARWEALWCSEAMEFEEWTIAGEATIDAATGLATLRTTHVETANYTDFVGFKDMTVEAHAEYDTRLEAVAPK